MLSYGNLLSNIEGIRETGIASEKDKTVAILPFHHSYPLMVTVLLPLTLGATVVFLPELSGEAIIKTLQKHRITVLVGVPRLYEIFHRRIFERINKNLFAKSLFKIAKLINNKEVSKLLFSKVHRQFGGNIRFFISGGAKLDKGIAEDLWALGFTIIEGYGLTETSPIVSFNPPERIKLGSVGVPIKGVKVKIEKGEIVVKGKNVMKGYLNKPQETKKVIKDGWFYTGDLGYIDEDGYIYITGRKKEIIVLPNGKNINPEEIEKKLLKISEFIQEVAVVEKEGKLYAVIYPNFKLLEEKGILNIKEFIKWEVIDIYNQHVPSYERIYGFDIVKEELPKTRLGKIKRFLLKDFLESQKEVKQTKEEPDFEEYKLIKEYLQKVSKKTVYPESHIEVDLGLDSLEKVEFLVFLEETFGVKISEEEFSKLDTVEKIARFVSEKRERLNLRKIDWKKILDKDIPLSVKERKLPIILLKRVLKPVFKIYNHLQIYGLENIPRNTNVIFTPNHQSFLDGFLLIASFPDDILEKTYFLAEEKFFKGKIGRFIADNFHVLTVNINKDLKISLQKTGKLLKSGKNVVIFPEGARTRDGNLMPFKKSFAILSKELDIPVVPVVIEGAYKSFPIGSLFPKPERIRLTFLEPVYPDDLDYEEIKDKVYKKIKSYLK
jgi:long-chain acyl-CoA synthetase